MAITDLTGYTWVGNETLTFTALGSIDVNSYYINFDYIYYDYPFPSNELDVVYDIDGDFTGIEQIFVRYGSNIVYTENGGWSNNDNKTITITGGTDATNADLIAWLEANGTLTPEPSTADKLQDLIDIKQDIKEAIENKGADLTGVDFGGYAEKIDELPAVVELTQEDYDELSVYDDNTYYLIVEEE